EDGVAQDLWHPGDGLGLLTGEEVADGVVGAGGGGCVERGRQAGPVAAAGYGRAQRLGAADVGVVGVVGSEVSRGDQKYL
ncbi:MAG TPA: hypothetical protein PLL20_21755, partial [Phycisphaerae bacterium]|nr:hypothetical protein [Phycisphaerae bacterium]